MTNHKITTRERYQNPITLTTRDGGNVYLKVGVPGENEVVTGLGEAGAHELIDLLTGIFGTPTFRSQFEKLAVGEQFLILPGNDRTVKSNAVKIDNERFYNYTKNWVKKAAGINPDSRIERI